FMARHLRRLCDWRGGERWGCAHFRKVAAWYGKALRVPKDDRHRLNLLASLADFDAIADRLRAQGPPPGWGEWDAQDAHVAVPAGPIAHW
ncbi:MAG: tRNA dihydrouridine synthase DusB, partial [Fimbriiglobus sp.]